MYIFVLALQILIISVSILINTCKFSGSLKKFDIKNRVTFTGKIPIVMLVLSLTLSYPLIKWVTIIAAVFLFLFNIVGLPGYPGLYDKFLIVVGLVFNAVTVWFAWTW